MQVTHSSPPVATADPGSASRIRVVAGKPGLDGHDRGIKVVTRALRDAGMEVIYLGMRLSVEQIADTAIDEDADVVAVNFAAADHLEMGARLIAALQSRGLRDDALVIAGGIIPDEDLAAMQALGFAAIFLPGTPIEQIVTWVRTHAPRRQSA